MQAHETCGKCGISVLASRMADHWIIAQHYSANVPAVSVRFPLDMIERPSGLVVPNVLKARVS